MQDLQWLAIPFVLTALIGMMIWGLQRDHRVHPPPVTPAADSAVDEVVNPPVLERPFQHLSTSLLQDRRYVCSLFGPDTPDLVVAFWADEDGDRPRVSSFRHLFLPTDDGLRAYAQALEAEFFEGVTEQGVPERSRLVVAYSFCWLPGLGQDLVVESRFREDHFQHQFYLADTDGKLNRRRLKDDSLEEEYLGADWIAYRGFLAAAPGGAWPREASEQLREWARHDARRASASAWLAHLALQGGAASSEVSRHLAVAREWQPDHLLSRILRARMKPGSAELLVVLGSLKEQIGLHSDRESQTTFMVSQALCALDQPGAARRLCEALLVDWPRHPGATFLLRLIDQNERGAQT